jgi:protein transport protein SEC13
MAVRVSQFDTGHGDLVHDTQFDYYGRRLATCSSDGIVRIFSVEQEPAQYLADLTGHQGPVWQVAWAHPKFGNVLASASFDHTVILWKEAQDGSWQILHRTDAYLHTGMPLLRTTHERRHHASDFIRARQYLRVPGI